jgi:hypothetical protein
MLLILRDVAAEKRGERWRSSRKKREKPTTPNFNNG